MRMFSCNACGELVEASDDECLLELDERSFEALSMLLHDRRPFVECSRCAEPSGVSPSIVVLTEQGTHALYHAGGPWADDALASEHWPQLSTERSTAHDSLSSLRDAVVRRCQSALERFQEATQHAAVEDVGSWFVQNQETLGAEIHTAAMLAVDDLIGLRLHNEDGSPVDAEQVAEMRAVVQCYACVGMCVGWADFRVDRGRLQERLDRLVFAETAVPSTASLFRGFVEDSSLNLAPHIAVALEVTHAWLCSCAGVENARAGLFTEKVFDLELLATVSGGDLPATAHAMRLSSERLTGMLDKDAFRAAVDASRNRVPPESIVETARRLGMPDLASHLVTFETPEWLKQLGSSAVGLGIVKGEDRPAFVMEWSKRDKQFDVTNLLASGRADAGDGGEDVFISYSSRDRIKAEAISRHLNAAGLTTFMDKHTPAGDLWTRTIPNALWSCGVVVVLWSRQALKSRWVREEAGAALERKVLFQALLDPIDLPTQFADVQAARLEAWSAEGAHAELAELAVAIRRKLGYEVVDTPTTSPDEVLAQLSRLQVAQAVFEMCDALAWHSIAPATNESLEPVGPAYERLKRALAPASHEDVHHLMQEFDLARVLLLVAIASADPDTGKLTFTLPHPFSVKSDANGTIIDCGNVHTNRSYLVSALSDMPRATSRGASHQTEESSDVFLLDSSLVIEIVPNVEDMAIVGHMLLRPA